MHTIELDAETENALNRLAATEGKSADAWLQEAVHTLIDTRTGREPLPSLAELRATQPVQKTGAGEFIREMRDAERY